jgi:predicted dehydrogenase
MKPGGAQQYRVLVVGCGSIGQRHIANMRQLGIEKIYAVDPRSKRRDEATSTFSIQVFESLESAWICDPEVVLITVPTSLHIPVALEAAARRCHLFIEKPLSHSHEGVACLERMIRQNELVTLVGCNLRFHPGLKLVKRLVSQGAIGKPIAVRAEVGQYLPDWHPGEDYRRGYSAQRELGGGVILDAIHEIDCVRWLLGEVSVAVCMAGKLSRLEIDTEDIAAILLRFESGALGEIHLDYIQRAYSRTCQVIGEEGTLQWDYSAGIVRWFSAQTKQWSTYANPEGWQPNEMYLDQMKHFLRCLCGDEEPVLSVSEGARVLEIALAAKEANRRQRSIELRNQSWNTNPIS